MNVSGFGRVDGSMFTSLDAIRAISFIPAFSIQHLLLQTIVIGCYKGSIHPFLIFVSFRVCLEPQIFEISLINLKELLALNQIEYVNYMLQHKDYNVLQF